MIYESEKITFASLNYVGLAGEVIDFLFARTLLLLELCTKSLNVWCTKLYK